MTDTRCETTELLVDQCGCRQHRGGQTVAEEYRELRAQLLLRPGWTAAQFPGCCARCGQGFPASAAIAHEPGLGWRAECCAT